MTTLQQLTDAQASPEVPVNENFETLSGAGIFGKRHAVTTGLTWGYYGGRYNGVDVADGTVTLTDAATNYVVVKRSDGVVSVSTASTNWSDATNYARLYQVTTASSAVSAVVDCRLDTGGLLNSGATTSSGSVPAVSTISGTAHSMVAADAGTYMRFTNAAAKTLTVQDNADEALSANTEYHGRNVGAADLTIVADTSVTINAPSGGTLVIPTGGTFTLKRVATDEFDLFGVTVAA